MAYADLREFVRKLEKEGELKRVRTEVDPNLEITEIVQRVGRDAGHGPGGGRGLRGQSGQPGMAVPHEGNYALPHILSGARVKEKADEGGPNGRVK